MSIFLTPQIMRLKARQSGAAPNMGSSDLHADPEPVDSEDYRLRLPSTS